MTMTGALKEIVSCSPPIIMVDNSRIEASRDCIKIDFKTGGDDPNRLTMYWNIRTASREKLSKYIGGVALLVDTNDGVRGKDIHTHLMGIEECESFLEDDKEAKAKKRYQPIDPYSPELLEILKPSIGVSVRADDNLDASWYQFIKDGHGRGEAKKMYTIGELQDLAQDLMKLKREMGEELKRLKERKE